MVLQLEHIIYIKTNCLKNLGEQKNEHMVTVALPTIAKKWHKKYLKTALVKETPYLLIRTISSQLNYFRQEGK